MNNYAVDLSRLESELLDQLQKANVKTILDDVPLISGLKKTREKASEIEIATEKALITEKNINEQRQHYKGVAAEGAMLYFLIISLNVVDHMYQYQLEQFNQFFEKAIQKTEEQENRVPVMILNIRRTIYQFISRGLFERHKIIFLTLMTFRLIQRKILPIDHTPQEMKFLLNCVPKLDRDNPLKEWLPTQAWYAVQRLGEVEFFKKFPESLEKELPQRFREWFFEQNPEQSSLPSKWKKLNKTFQKLLVLRALRPDRMIPALSEFIKDNLDEGSQFINMDQQNQFQQILHSAFKDATQTTALNIPIFFILSAGANPVSEVSKMGQEMDFSVNKNNFFNIALGQGQDEIAEERLDIGVKDGHWIMLQNIHLMPSWLPTLEKKLDEYTKKQGQNIDFRLFLQAEPQKAIPIGILERCIKLTNEPPSGLKANMNRAWTYFNPNEIDKLDAKIKPILFGLCFFHQTLLERRKFGPKGWNMFYPFNIGDLRDSYYVLVKNVDGMGRVPWDDLKYIFGEIMYGGHIVDDWDRVLCNSYLNYLITPKILMEDFELFPYSNT